MSIREGEDDVAELYVRKAMERFGKTAREKWEKRGVAGRNFSFHPFARIVSTVAR
jgi:hypothetical protein